MANELTFANLETNAGLAHYLYGALHALLFDPTDLRATMVRKEFKGGMGSDTVKVTTYAPSHTFTAATSELVGGASNESVGSGNFELNPTRRLMKWQVSDLWRLVAPNGSLDLDLLARLLFQGTGLTVTDMVCALFPSLSNSVGSTTGQMSVDFMYDAQFKLNNERAPGPFYMVLAPHPFNKWQASLRGEGGAVQFSPATREMLVAKGPGYKGSFGTIEVIDSDSVTLDGGSTYRRNAMFAEGCFGYTEAPVPDVADALPPNVKTIVDGIVRMVHAYDADNALTSIIGDYYPSVVEQEDKRGTLINALAA